MYLVRLISADNKVLAAIDFKDESLSFILGFAFIRDGNVLGLVPRLVKIGL